MSLQTKYFIYAVIMIGSIGIWLPIGMEALIKHQVDFHNIPPNVTTYFVSILFAGCIDFFLSKIRKLNYEGIASIFMSILGIGLLGVALVTASVILNVYNCDKLALIIGLIGVVVAFRIWWLANVDNSNFIVKAVDSLGNNPQTTLSNGN